MTRAPVESDIEEMIMDLGQFYESASNNRPIFFTMIHNEQCDAILGRLGEVVHACQRGYWQEALQALTRASNSFIQYLAVLFTSSYIAASIDWKTRYV